MTKVSTTHVNYVLYRRYAKLTKFVSLFLLYDSKMRVVKFLKLLSLSPLLFFVMGGSPDDVREEPVT